MVTRHERILTAIDGGMPDRPPIAFDAHGAALQGVLDHFGVETKNDLYAAAGIDGFSVWDWNAVMGDYTGSTRNAPDGTPCDFWGNAPQKAWGLAECGSLGDLEAFDWPTVDQFDFSRIHDRAMAIRDQDMVVSAGHIGVGYQMHNMLRGTESALMDVFDEPWMAAYTERLTRFTLEYLDALLTAGRGAIEVVRADDDVGTMNHLMVSPEMWRRFYKPCWMAAFDLVHAHGVRVWFHSCGYIWPLLEDLVEIGVDCWNPFPEYVKDNGHERLRDSRRGRLSLDGGVSHLVLVKGTPQEAREETRRVLETFAADGGLLIGPSQVFTEDMPTENILAFFNEALAWA